MIPILWVTKQRHEMANGEQKWASNPGILWPVSVLFILKLHSTVFCLILVSWGCACNFGWQVVLPGDPK